VLVVLLLVVSAYPFTIGMADPSAVYCGEMGYDYEIRDNELGQYGACINSPVGLECDSWDFYNGDCELDSSLCGGLTCELFCEYGYVEGSCGCKCLQKPTCAEEGERIYGMDEKTCCDGLIKKDMCVDGIICIQAEYMCVEQDVPSPGLNCEDYGYFALPIQPISCAEWGNFPNWEQVEVEQLAGATCWDIVEDDTIIDEVIDTIENSDITSTIAEQIGLSTATTSKLIIAYFIITNIFLIVLLVRYFKRKR